MSLIQSLGADYFNQFFNRALFLYEGRVLEVTRTSNTYVDCIDRTTGDLVRVPNAFFTGFKVFEYPKLGYRRFNEHCVGFATKIQSAMRGLKAENVEVQYSPVTRAIAAIRGTRAGAGRDIMSKPLMTPQYDKASEMQALLDGRKTGLVLNEFVLIEPSLSADNAAFNIFYKQARVGKMSAGGVCSWYNDKHSGYITKIMEAA